MNYKQVIDQLCDLMEQKWWAILFEPILPTLLVFHEGKWRQILRRADDTDLDLEIWRRSVAALRPQAVALVGMATPELLPYRVVAAVEFQGERNFIWTMKWKIEEDGLGEQAPLEVGDHGPQYESLFDPPMSVQPNHQDIVFTAMGQTFPSPMQRSLLLIALFCGQE